MATSTHLSLRGATILLLRGWGKVAKPDRNDHRVDLRDPGQFIVSRSTMLGEKPVLSIPIAQLRLGSYTKQITSGGGWIGGGFGITEAMLGAYQAQLLNRLTTHTREYTILAATAELPNGAQREAILGYRTIDEAELRDRLSAAVPPWAHTFIAATVETSTAATAQPHLRGAYHDIDQMRQHRLVNAKQALDLCALASEPLIAALINRIATTAITAGEAEQIAAHTDELRDSARITPQQAHAIHSRLHRQTGPPPPTAPSERQRRQITALAALRTLGAMNQAGFEAEQARILSADD